MRRGGFPILLCIVVLSAALSSCRNPADPQSPTQPPTLGFTLRGIVAEAGDGGDGIGAVLVEITSGASSGTSTTTDALGQFSFAGVTGQFNVRFSKEGWVPTGTTVNVTANLFINVTMEPDDSGGPDPGPTFTLSGVVTRKQGDMDPIAGALVEVIDGERAGDSATTDALGRYSIPELSGEVTIRTTRDGFEALEKVVEMTGDVTLIITLITPPDVRMCLDLDDEEVHITNNDPLNELILTDWTLWEDVDGNSFTFTEDLDCRTSMSGFTLAPGATVIITAGDDPEHDPPTYIAGFCEVVWDNEGDLARLVNPDTAKNGPVVEAIGSFASCGG